jgi:cephalosporin-C deacetylase
MDKLYECQIEHLKDYKGIGDPPKDYDEYWARARKDLENASLEYELVKSDFVSRSCDAYDLYFIEGKIPAVVMFHGYWSNSGEWSGKLPYIAEGFCVLAMDVRGQGGLSVDNGIYKGNTQSGHIIRGLESDSPDDLFYRNVYLDTAQCVKILKTMDFVDEKNIFATGASQGGALTIACASLVDDLKGAAAIYPFLKNRAKDVKCDILWMTALMDNVCPPFSQMAAYNSITSNKRIVFFPEYQHEYLLYSGDIILKFFLELLES